jgi:hypothetical protein
MPSCSPTRRQAPVTATPLSRSPSLGGSPAPDPIGVLPRCRHDFDPSVVGRPPSTPGRRQVGMLAGLGYDTGIDLRPLMETSRWLAGHLARPSPFGVVRTLPRPTTRQRTTRTGLRGAQQERDQGLACCSSSTSRCRAAKQRAPGGRTSRLVPPMSAEPWASEVGGIVLEIEGVRGSCQDHGVSRSAKVVGRETDWTGVCRCLCTRL